MKKRFLTTLFGFICIVCATVGFISSNNTESTATAEETSTQVIDMYLIAGQSNAVGYSYHDNMLSQSFSNIGYAGETDKSRHTGTASSGNVSAFKDFYWEVKAGYGRTNENVGPEYGMAQVLNQYYSADNSAFIFKSAAGGTSLRDLNTDGSGSYGNWYPRSEWAEGFTPSDKSPTGLQYYNFVENFKTVYNELKKNGYEPKVKAMVWMQGCSDYTLPNVYEPLLRALITDMRTDLKAITGDDELAQMPFIIGKIPTTLVEYNNPDIPAFNEMQQRVADSMTAVKTIETSDLIIVKEDGTCNGRDEWHFSGNDAVTLGQRFASKILELCGNDGLSLITNGNGRAEYTIDGDNVIITVTPNKGYTLSSMKINGADVAYFVKDNTYTFKKIDPYYNVVVNFRPDGSENYVYEEEIVMDIAEYFSSTEYMSNEGVFVKGQTQAVSRLWLSALLERSCGISFVTKFENDFWKGDVKQYFSVSLGASEFVYTLDEDNGLLIKIRNNLSGELLSVLRIPNFDVTESHKWRIARVNTQDSTDQAYGLRVYLDGKILTEKHDVNQVTSSSYHGVYVWNRTDTSMSLKSALDKKVEFVEEQNVLDITEFDGREELFSVDGLQVVNSSAKLSGDWSNHSLESRAVNIEWVGDYTKLSNGLQWKMKANSTWTLSSDLMRLNIGATQIHLNWNKVTREMGTYTHTMWSEETEHLSSVAAYTKLMDNYEPTEWHTWRIVRVAAANARGYAVRFYIDGEFCAELYTIGELTDKHLNSNGSYSYNKAEKGFHAVRFVNCSGTTVSFKSAYYTRPVVEKETVSDIMYYGANTELLNENGKVFKSGSSAVDNNAGESSSFGKEWYAYSNGIEFMMKALDDWGNDYDELKIMLGATQIRINSKGNNKITLHIYNMAHDYSGGWGQEYPISTSFDATKWHTIKVTRRKFVQNNGYYDEKGIQVAVYIDGEKVIETVQNLSGMWSFANRRLAVTNNSGVDIAFKSTLSKEEFEHTYIFEDDNISELYEMPQHSQNTYYENAFGEGLAVRTGNRIINSISSEEYSSTTNGLQFALTSVTPWKTSGVSKTPVELTAKEMETLTKINGKEVFKRNGTGEYEEIALTGLSGKKYKFVYQDWTSDWTRMKSGDGIRLTGETDQTAWLFPSLWKNPKGELFYSEETSTRLMTEDWMATKYHLHVDFGTMTLNYKLTPDNKMVVRVYSRYTWVLMFEDYVRDENGNPIEFLTGTYNGDSAITYNRKTLNDGDLYENTFKISKVKEIGGNGFILRLWVNGYLVCEVYDSHPLGGESMYSYLLIDNLAGTTVNAKSIATFDDFKTEQKAKFDAFVLVDYSSGNLEKVEALIAEAKDNIDDMNAIAKINAYVTQTLQDIEKIWTIETENEFALQKTTYLSQLNRFMNNAYEDEEKAQITALFDEATNIINLLSEEEGFAGLASIYEEYYAKISSVLTSAQKQQVLQARLEAKALLAEFAGEFAQVENSEKIAEIKSKYEAKIDACVDIMEIEALAYAARTEMWVVESQYITVGGV